MIGIIPILFLIYFSVLIYKEKSQRVEMIGDHIDRIAQSENLGELIAELARERRFSYLYTIKKVGHDEITLHRLKTDSIISLLQNKHDLTLDNFTKYTFLDDLATIRNGIDTSSAFPPSAIVEYYTDAIVRLNMLNSATPASHTFLLPVSQDLMAQQMLSEMITFLDIMRTNIFNKLNTKEYKPETLLATLGVYKIYNSYEKEFLLKASPSSIKLYNNKKILTDYGPTMDYINKLFITMKFDSTYNADQWWDISTEGLKVLRKQQSDLWNSVDTRMKELYHHENNLKNATFIFLLIGILFVIGFVAYFINDVTKLLRELKFAARKISKGETGIKLNNMPHGVVGNLARSIIQIDKNNLLLAEAANQIGKGDFNVNVKPRSNEDLLGISIKKMQHDLAEFTSQKDKIQKETEELVYKRDEFFSIASHELKTPVTSLKAYTQLLLMDAADSDDVERKKMLGRMDIQINKLTALINDLLDTSKVQSGQLAYNKEHFQMKDLASEIIEEIRPTASECEIDFIANADAQVYADRDRIGQVVTNFLTNAIKYAPKSNKIIVELNRKEDKIICSVQDFGNGIIEEEQNKIFERFYRVSGNNLNTFPGLGLGLFICKEIIEKHSGEIWIESEKGKGSTFCFDLPVS